ncbi:hypothetical protein PCO85_16435 [Prodigiosinella aquatilis]|nr:protealysin inhibitor emfourin [Prodigiosinella sp. LS101]WJV52792.1 hypothetical protein PCO85_16435 [Prodigiosinella sp. LS101]WJV57145.1 hypothetical protein PCO84_16415 [Pectobacteriaceae bacterium C111]
MNIQPALTDDAVIELAREGGFAWIPKLAGHRRFALADIPSPAREKTCTILRNIFSTVREPDRQSPPGRGDQFYYRIHISYSNQHNAPHQDIVLLIPECDAPVELEALWRNGPSE